MFPIRNISQKNLKSTTKTTDRELLPQNLIKSPFCYRPGTHKLSVLPDTICQISQPKIKQTYLLNINGQKPALIFRCKCGLKFCLTAAIKHPGKHAPGGHIGDPSLLRYIQNKTVTLFGRCQRSLAIHHLHNHHVILF